MEARRNANVGVEDLGNVGLWGGKEGGRDCISAEGRHGRLSHFLFVWWVG